MSVAFTSALLCDQIRQEMNGKFFLIGVYSSSVLYGVFPAIGHFQLFARVRIESTGEQKIMVRVLVSGVENQKFEGNLMVEKPNEDWLSIPLQPVEFQVPGRLTVEQSDGDDEWREFFSISVARPPIA